VVALLLLDAPAAALAAATGWVGDEHSAARLVTATDAVGSAATVEAGLEIRLAPGWHAYWRAPGDAGIPPAIDWSGSENLKDAKIAWPAPKRYSLQGFETAGYRDHVLLPVTLGLAHPGHKLTLHAKADWAACAQICVPFSANFTLALPAGPGASAPEAGLIAAAQARVPGTLAAAGWQLQAADVVHAGGDPELVLRVTSPQTAFSSPDLFVEGLEKGSPGRPQLRLSQSGHVARLAVPIRDAHGAVIAGKPLIFTLVDGARAAEFGATPRAAPPPRDGARLLSIIGIALLGGLILNAMPCVLPVLSLKLLAVAAQAGEERRRMRLGLLVTAAGVLASFAAIAAVLIALKSAGAAVGWGIQFQWPWFIAGMAAVTTLFAASLWGWLPIGLPRTVYDAAGAVRPRRRYADAFLTGAFATLLATPCSAPFVGTAIGFALSQGPNEIAFVFAAMGLGFASPYLLVAAAPRLVGFLPRPGRWLYALRALLGAALAGTALWLLFVLAALSGLRVALGTGAALILVLLLLALKSRRGIPVLAARFASAATAAVVAGSVLWPAFAGVERSNPTAEAGRWQDFDAAAIPRFVGEGKTVFVDVGAAWCLTCKVNEAAVLERGRVAQRLFGPGVVAMHADWTRPDPAITAYLESFGRYGVPFDAVYGPERPAGEALPELLTAGVVEAALDRAAR
jgi:suppressor for copper-sensitivity B